MCPGKNKETSRAFSLYVHLPFCLSRCSYCAFVSSVCKPLPESEYLEAVLSQYRLELAAWRQRPLDTIYFGGGTPTLFSPRFFRQLLAALAADFSWSPAREITVEANPDTLSPDRIRALLDLGINRFSLGVQTFSPRGLRLLGRRHSAAASREAVALLRRCQVENLSVDLIYAYPGQIPADLRADLAAVVELEPEHVSAYCFSLEPGTPLARRAAAGEFVPLTPAVQGEFMAEVITTLTACGYQHYEIANFSRPGRQSRHNLAYWQLRDYWGLGAGAWSARRLERSRQLWACRYVRENDGEKYRRLFGRRPPPVVLPPPVVVDRISYETSFAERIIMGLRLRRGVDLGEVAAEYDRRLVAAVLERLDDFLAAGFVGREGDLLFLTDRGLPLADEIALRVLP